MLNSWNLFDYTYPNEKRHLLTNNKEFKFHGGMTPESIIFFFHTPCFDQGTHIYLYYDDVTSIYVYIHTHADIIYIYIYICI